MQIDVHLEMVEGKVLACVEDSAGIFASILQNCCMAEGFLTSICNRDNKPFARIEMPEMIVELRKLIPAAVGAAGRLHVEQIVQLATRCGKDRNLQLCFLPRAIS